MKTKNVLSLDCKDAQSFFMEPEQFYTCELPEYFDFSGVLKYVSKAIGNKDYEKCIAETGPEGMSGVNLEILLNKDGRYAVRPLSIVNPFLYFFIVREICSKDNWAFIRECFRKFTVPDIVSCAIPVIPEKAEAFHKSASILNWWNSMEQRSLELSLEYRYMFVTDITDCYGSVNPQAFDWALSMKGTSSERSEVPSLSANIRKYLRALQQGRNVGIPQGSAVFDFLGEIILGYADLLLHERLERDEKVSKSYEILRFRDDYRIFCNDKDVLEEISYTLQGVLEELNFRMNPQKTRISDSVITDSIKPDKLFYIYNTPIYNKNGVDFDGLEKHLLFVLMLGRQFPNCGQLKTQLSKIDKRIAEILKPHLVKVMDVSVFLNGDSDKTENKYKEVEFPGRIRENIRVLSAIAAQIAIENVNVSHYALRIVSRMVDSMKDDKERWDIIDKVYRKLCDLPNSLYNELWLQNITYQKDAKEGRNPYRMKLCRLAGGDQDVQIWNNAWLKPGLYKAMPIKSIVDWKKLKESTPVITFRETRAYSELIDKQ